MAFHLNLPEIDGYYPVFASIREEITEKFCNLYKLILGEYYMYYPLITRSTGYSVKSDLFILYTLEEAYADVRHIVEYITDLILCVKEHAMSVSYDSLSTPVYN